MNEKAVFFLSSEKKKNDSEIEWMNDMWTFPGKKKKTEKTPKNAEKKKHNLLFNKIIETPPDFEWMANELFLGKKKKQVVFFFSRFAEKKKNEFQDFEWMNGPWTFPRKKKNTVPLPQGSQNEQTSDWKYRFSGSIINLSSLKYTDI